MATTTPNYGWTVPTSTDLVKDGATAIETLGDAIDASMNTALGTKKAGMVLLNTTSFSGVASQSVNDVFSATYQNYRIILNHVTSATDAAISFRLRVSGTDNSSNNYYWSSHYNSSTTETVSGNKSTGLTNKWDFSDGGNVDGGSNVSADIFNPFLSKRTAFTGSNTYIAGADNINYTVVRAGATSVNTSYTGFTLIPASGNITGSVSVYGYNK